MSHSKSAIALLSENIATYEQVTSLLDQSGDDGFTITWVDIRQAPPPDQLPSDYDAYLSDAPLAYWLEHQNFVQNHICFWLVTTEIAQTELFNQGVADCFLLSEFNAILLKHSLRRQRAIAARDGVSPLPLEEFQGDRFQTLVNNIPGAVYRCLHSDEWQGMYISDAITEIVGYPAADFTAAGDRTFASLIHPEDLAFVEKTLDQHLAQQEPFALEYRLVHRDGSIRWIDERGQGFFDGSGNLLWIDGVIIDISEKKKLANDLQQHQRDYYEKTPAMLHSVNGRGEIITVSDRWLETMGYERSEVVGRKSTEFLTVQSCHYAESYALPLFFKNGYIEDVEYQFIKKNGELLDMLLSATTYDFGGEKRSLAVLVDITTRNKLTAELERYQNRLQAIAHQRTKALALSEKRFRSVFDLAPMGIVELDLQGQFRLVNQQFIAMLDLTVEALLLCRVMDVTYGEDAETIGAIVRQLRAGVMTTFSGDYRYCRGETWFWGHLEIAAVSNIHGEVEYFIATIEDIHDRKVMEESLRLSEARLAKAQAITEMGVWQWDVINNYVYWSEESSRLFGIPVGSIEPSLEAFWQFVHPEDVPVLQERLAGLFSSSESAAVSEYRIITPAGQIKVIQDYLEITRDELGQVTSLSGATKDITEMRNMITALKASEARLAKAQAIAKLGAWEWDVVNNRTYWSEESFRLFNLPVDSFDDLPDEPSVETYFRFVHPDDAPHIQAVTQEILEGAAAPEFVEYRIITLDGQTKIVRDYLDVVRNESGQVTCLSGATQDITEMRSMITAIETSEARLAKAQAIAKVGIWEWELATNILIWSDEFYRIFDLEPHSIEPDFEAFMAMVNPGDRCRIAAAVETLRSGEKVYGFEYHITTAQNRQKIVLEHVDAVSNEQGEVTHFSGTLQDVTDFREANLALKASEARFRELVEHIDECFWVNPAQPTKVDYVSPAYEAIWGRSCESLVAHGRSWLKSVHPDHRSQVSQAIINMKAGQDFNEEYRIVQPDGEERWVYGRSAKILDENGTLLRHVGVVSDVTERKQMELNLLRSEGRFRGIFEQAALGIAQVNFEHQFLLVNQAFCNLVGYTEAELQQMTWQDLTHPDDLHLRQPSINQIIAGDQKCTVFEKRYIHKQGHTIWIKAIASFIYGEDNQPKSLLALVEDITTFKQAEVQLAQSQNRYRDLVEGIHGIIYQYSSKRGGIFYSSRVKEILGYDVEFLLEHRSLLYESIHPEDKYLVEQQLEALQHGQNIAKEYRIRDAWGQWHWFHNKTFSVEKVGDELIINGLALDITQRKEADAALRNRLNLEMVLAEISQLMIVQPELDLTEVLQPLGETFRACGMAVMVRRTGTELLDQLASWNAPHVVDVSDEWQVIDSADYPWFTEQWLQQQYILINDVHDIPDAVALEREVLIGLNIHSLMLIPLSDHQGEAWGYISCTSSQQRPKAWSKEDADLLAIAGDLIYNYYERRQARKQLEQARDAAEAANRTKTQFLTSMSHELRTPLNAVLGFTQIMEYSATFPDQHRDHLRILHRSGTRLLSLLNDILALASFEGGTPTLNKTLFNLPSLLDDLENMLRSNGAVQRGVDFQIVRDENLPRYITADQAKLHSVLTHLLGNALKFTSHGEVRLEVEAIAVDPLVLRFRVTDTGIGISEADLQKLFNNFVKLEGGEKFGQGSGIGLALSQKFVTLMGSTITVSSNINGGSCFTFELQCDDRLPEMTGRSPEASSHDKVLPLPTPETFQALPLPWREEFHHAACAARAQRLEKLLATLPPEHQAIAQTLQQCIDQLDFEQLAELSQL